MSEMQTIHSLAGPKIAILGASGRLGQLIRPFWQGDNTIWHARNPSGGHTSFDLLKKPALLAKLLEGASAVICLAGVTPYSTDGDLEDNCKIATACLDAALASKVRRVLLMSTAAIYGNAPGPLKENGPIQPVSKYGFAKVEMENLANKHEQSSTILRLGNVVGADAILGNWHPAMKLEFLGAETSPKRSYIGPETLARVLYELTLLDELPPTLNISAPNSIHMHDLLDQAELPYEQIKATQNTIADVTLDTGLLENFVAFTALDSLPSAMVAQWKTAVSAK